MDNIYVVLLGKSVIAFPRVPHLYRTRRFMKYNVYRKCFKRVFDIVISIISLVLLSPVLFLLSVLGIVFMDGNPFFVQKRTGKEGNTFSLIKFRSMNNKHDDYGNLLPDDERLSKYGRFIRTTSLDELPELINILKGDMSLVGPRPLLIEYLPYYTEVERCRFDVLPGLTGLAQINGRNAIDWDTKLSYDVQYVQDITFRKDLIIVLKTFFKVLKRSDIQLGREFKTGKFIEQRKELLEKQK